MTGNDLDRGLSHLLADYQVFYQKLRGYHWNVTGPLFFGLHQQFEEMYNDAALKVDEVAERLAARGVRPPSTLKETLELTRLTEDGATADPRQMVQQVIDDLGSLNGSLRELSATAGESGDAASINLLDGFADGQEKTAWMLRAFLAG